MTTANVRDAVLSSFSKGTYSDLTIICKDKSFKVHKTIVCTQSEFLANAVKDGFKEAIDATIQLEEDEATTVEAMLQYLYYGAYKLDEADDFSSPRSDMSMSSWPSQLPVIEVSDIITSHLDIYALADKICLTPLRQLAEAKLTKELNSEPFWRISLKLSEIITKVNSVAPPDDDGRRLRAVVAKAICDYLSELAADTTHKIKLEHKMNEMAKYARELNRLIGEAEETDAPDESVE